MTKTITFNTADPKAYLSQLIPKLYYAKIKGCELIDGDGLNWCYKQNKNGLNKLFLSFVSESDEEYKTFASKAKWNGLGINDTNADFEEVEELEDEYCWFCGQKLDWED